MEVFAGFFGEGFDESRAGVEIGEDEFFIGLEFFEGAWGVETEPPECSGQSSEIMMKRLLV